MNVEAAVKSFHARFGSHIGHTPAIPDTNTQWLRLKLCREEWAELEDALEYRQVVEIAKEAADLVYVVVGLCVSYGIPFNDVFRVVHRSNMLKTGGGSRSDGKLLKPAGWVAPDVAGVLGL